MAAAGRICGRGPGRPWSSVGSEWPAQCRVAAGHQATARLVRHPPSAAGSAAAADPLVGVTAQDCGATFAVFPAWASEDSTPVIPAF